MPDALNVNVINVGYGGVGKLMHDSLLSEKDDFLGPFPAMLKVGDMQSFAFKPSDDEPFWIAPAQRIKLHFDVKVRKTKPRTKNQNKLKQEMFAIDSQVNVKVTAKQLQEKARTM
eukprot:13581203-Ditylum_brightwellii.AAC.1